MLRSFYIVAFVNVSNYAVRLVWLMIVICMSRYTLDTSIVVFYLIEVVGAVSILL
eukprot:gene3112-2094_t